MNKFTTEELHEYLEFWYDNETPNDFSVAWDKGYTDICLYLIGGSGALRGSDEDIAKACYKAYLKLKDKAIHKQMKKCFKHCVFLFDETNSAICIPVNDPDVDYFISIDDAKSWGYIYDGNEQLA